MLGSDVWGYSYEGGRAVKIHKGSFQNHIPINTDPLNDTSFVCRSEEGVWLDLSSSMDSRFECNGES